MDPCRHWGMSPADVWHRQQVRLEEGTREVVISSGKARALAMTMLASHKLGRRNVLTTLMSNYQKLLVGEGCCRKVGLELDEVGAYQTRDSHPPGLAEQNSVEEARLWEVATAPTVLKVVRLNQWRPTKARENREQALVVVIGNNLEKRAMMMATRALIKNRGGRMMAGQRRKSNVVGAPSDLVALCAERKKIAEIAMCRIDVEAVLQNSEMEKTEIQTGNLKQKTKSDWSVQKKPLLDFKLLCGAEFTAVLNSAEMKTAAMQEKKMKNAMISSGIAVAVKAECRISEFKNFCTLLKHFIVLHTELHRFEFLKLSFRNADSSNSKKSGLLLLQWIEFLVPTANIVLFLIRNIVTDSLISNKICLEECSCWNFEAVRTEIPEAKSAGCNSTWNCFWNQVLKPEVEKLSLQFECRISVNPVKLSSKIFLTPELARTWKASTTTDVFAFGAFFFEVACGRRPVDLAADSEHPVLLDWVSESWRKGLVLTTADPRLGDEFPTEEVELVLKLGLLCSHPLPAARPSMCRVVQYLEGDLTPSKLEPTHLSFPGFVPHSGKSSNGHAVAKIMFLKDLFFLLLFFHLNLAAFAIDASDDEFTFNGFIVQE
ncbi:hypothetical protein ZIOFF_001449 [Zingiber officinale]|uniref:Uncharacterized protein n=1 Tax=Zingiber officinale TaxID=94328 RepID=A0A8J5I9V2_ZINOF|nr:hypothetical protein ZIOFF_001449 [Zingiber officinale]